MFRVAILVIISIFAITAAKWNKSRVFDICRLYFPVVLLGYLYKETDYMNNLIFKTDLDPLFANLEEFIFGMQPSVEFSSVMSSEIFAELMYFGYFAYYLMILFIPVYLYFKTGRQESEQLIFIMINSFLIYYLVFILLPVGGPQFYFKDPSHNLPGGYVFGTAIRFIQEVGEAPTAAFPSSHASIYLMLTYVIYKFARKLLFIAISIGFLLLLSTVYIRAHYVVDVLFAMLYTPSLFIFSKKLHTRLSGFTKLKEI
jgi:membrane-associated phospholipid phosphatase